MRAFAQSCSTKIEAQHRQRQAPRRVVENLHGVVHHLVVHGSAAPGVGMANDRGEGRIGSAFVQHCLERMRIGRERTRTGADIVLSRGSTDLAIIPLTILRFGGFFFSF